MKGYPLSMFTEVLTKVPARHNENPGKSFNLRDELGFIADHLEERHGADHSLEDGVRHLSADVLKVVFTFDQLCKFKYGQFIMMDRSVEELFDEEPAYAIVRKIQSSMWRWGMGDKAWNEVVDTYDAIRRFDLGVEGFEVRLDFTTWHNERGYSRESRTFLDGVFGFLVYYKGEHVMTLGFSVQKGRRLLVQQVQLTKRKGNRFLFKLPANRMEFFLKCFKKAFKRYTVCVADGADIARTNLNSYKSALDQARGRKEEDRDLEHIWELEEKVEHLTADLPRLRDFYANTGRFKRGEAFKANRITHYKLAA